VSNSVIVMYLGRVAEAGPKNPVYGSPRHPYTNALLSAAPGGRPRGGGDPAAHHPDRRRALADQPARGLPVHPRCPKAQELCGQEIPPLEAKTGDPHTHVTACHFPVQEGEVLARAGRTAGRQQR